MLTAFTGCLSGSEADPSTEEDTPATPDDDEQATLVIPWSLTNCTAVAAAVPVDSEVLSSHLPSGFTPWTPAEAGLPPHPTADAVLTLEAWRCEQGSTLDGETMKEMSFGAIEAPVHAPEGIPVAEDAYTPYSWQMLIPDEPRRALLQDAGVPAVAGTVDLSGYTPTPAGSVFSVRWELDGEAYTFTGTTQRPMDRGTVAEEEITIADGGYAVWSSTIVDDQVVTGTGTLEVPAGSLAAEIIGSESTQAFLLTGEPGFEDGRITLPAQG